MDELLFNGEYYEQRLDDVDEHRYQYGAGCLSDQLLGQTLAHLVGLGHLFPADHVRDALRAIRRHNFRTDFSDYHSVQRTYALNDDRGLVLCTWPRGGRPRIPFVYSDEVWTGIEYQVATGLVYEGLVDEALEIVRAVRDRYDGVRRNPWNEVECGNHYVRSMASWGLLLALTGCRWDGRDQTLRLAPVAAARAGDRFATFFSTGTAWGTVDVSDGTATVAVLHGTLEVSRLELDGNDLGRYAGGPATLEAGATVTLSPV